MGNSLACLVPKEMTNSRRIITSSSSINTTSSPFSKRSRSTKKKKQDGIVLDDEVDLLLKQQALAAALLFQEHQRNAGAGAGDPPVIPFINRSTSVVYPSPQPKKQSFTRSSSTSRQRSRSDTLNINHHPPHDHQLLVPPTLQDSKIDGLETNHIVLVHGGGFGAWCWYKTMTLLEEGGFKVDAVDLTGSGVHSSDTNSITSLAQYVKPLTDILEKLEDGKKVILVGHDFGGACLSYVMELFPSKIAKSIFIAATMLASGQSILDLLSQQLGSNDLMGQAQIFLYGHGKNQPPTAIDLNKELDIALASVSMRPIPFAPVTEKLTLSEKNYGSVRRFYIVTQEDQAIPVPLQETMINSNPPEQVFRVKGSDHAPFFSRPQALHKILVEIFQIPPPNQV
ncbi:hypothetical protein FEM48_Zijuj10G0099800 [Ziziphus jujuba var. spinosa]|uniref:AB hydrolase-1 domain-containing protein n=1 Tax=Ziziphus jujuba var. spinosa TaxID=714518 RepID=A0A978UMQ5_ZIZJJ|nr:hypothetical protein FEM48_Zijuj10G0099800 [Ziziphus jujuba var. spinosa]